jgi:hypothetical protein
MFEKIVLNETGHKGRVEPKLDLIERLDEKTNSVVPVGFGRDATEA